MWNDEDNNPYGAFDNEAHLSESLHSATLSPSKALDLPSLSGCSLALTPAALYDREYTPPSPSSRSSTDNPPDFLSQQQDLSDEDDAPGYVAQQSGHGYLRKSVYDSRIEQILYENPEMPILITDAGKNHEGGGSFIVYTIRTGVYQNDARATEIFRLIGSRILRSADGIPSSRRCDKPS